MSEIQRFRKKPVTVEMIRWDGTGQASRLIGRHAGGRPWLCDSHIHDGALIIFVRKGTTHAHVALGDWVALEADGSGVYPLADDVRLASYEPADSAVTDPLMAARELVRAAEASGDLPEGWDDNPVHGKPDDPEWAAQREHACGKCGETFGSNFQPGEVDCPECDARLCSSCGHWEGGSE